MKAIILAGGFGTRLKNLTKETPKPLIKIRGKTILDYQLDLLARYGFKDIILSLYRFPEKIIEQVRKRTERITPIIEETPLGTGGAIEYCSRGINQEFMVLNGDVLTDINLKNFIENHRGNTIALCRANIRDYGYCKLKGLQITDFLEKINQDKIGWVNAGFYILSPEVFKKERSTPFSIERDVFPKLAREGKLYAFSHKGYWIDVGTPERLSKARKDLCSI